MMDQLLLCYKDELRNFYIAGTGLCSGLLFGYITAIIAGILPIVTHDFGLSSAEITVLGASILFAASFGALLSGSFADKYGRKNIILACALIYMVSSFVPLLNYNYYALLISRLISGIALGVSSFVAPLYLGEAASNNNRGRVILINSLGITSGIVLAYIVTVLTSDIKIYLSLPVFIGILLFGCAIKLNEVSSKNLHSKYYGSKKLFIIGIVLALLQQFSGINFILYYTPFMFENSINIKTLMIIIGLINLIFTFVAVALIDYIGRRKLLLIGFSIMAVTMLLISYNLHLNNKVNNIITINIFVFIASFAMSIGSVFWVIVAEIYPEAIRARAISFMTFVNWFANCLVSLIFIPLAINASVTAVFISFAFVSLFGISFSYYYLPETRGRALGQVNS